NSGTMNIDSSRTLTVTAGGSFTNTGSIDVRSGTLSLQCTGSEVRTDGLGRLATSPGTTTAVKGNFDGASTDADLFAPGGTVRFDGHGTATSPQLFVYMS